jgi:pimeloyl-ACP methyl ester carboxylesterase
MEKDARFKQESARHLSARPLPCYCRRMPKFLDEPLRGGYVKSFDGLQIHWELFGKELSADRTPIFFFYGLACSKYQWRTIAEIYSKDHPILFFDYRGHHRSENVPSDSGSMNFGQLAKDAAAILNELNIKSTHIFAHSMGCNVALELAFAQPDLVKSLVLVAGSAQNPFSKMLGVNFLDKIMSPVLESFSGNKENFYLFWRWILRNRLLIRLIVSNSGFNMKAVERQDVDTYLDSVFSVSPRVFFELLRELARGTTESLLPRIKTPTLVVSGGNDQVTPPAIQKSLADGLPNSHFFSVPLGSHNVQLEFADYLARKIKEFWADITPPSKQ